MITDQQAYGAPRLVTPMACFLLVVLISGVTAEEQTAPTLSDEEKLEIILDGKNEFSRSHRIRAFAREGEIDAVGRLVTIGKTVYFKTADQSFIPEDKRFPYPELLLEVHVTEAHAYQPLFRQGILKRRSVVYDGPLRVQGNWAYEGAYHIFGLVWVDKVSKVNDSPDADWGPWLKKHATSAPSKNASSK